MDGQQRVRRHQRQRAGQQRPHPGDLPKSVQHNDVGWEMLRRHLLAFILLCQRLWIPTGPTGGLQDSAARRRGHGHGGGGAWDIRIGKWHTHPQSLVRGVAARMVHECTCASWRCHFTAEELGGGAAELSRQLQSELRSACSDNPCCALQPITQATFPYEKFELTVDLQFWDTSPQGSSVRIIPSSSGIDMFNAANTTRDMVNGWRLFYTEWQYLKVNESTWFQKRTGQRAADGNPAPLHSLAWNAPSEGATQYVLLVLGGE